ncbi:glycerol-3-phosphate dehydrogenase [Flavobacterium glycines]|uniref:FAD-dependent oxidoreductase n=1 Tax=Flavobacterium glycines TaxID=551990 RepID=A0A1B9DHM4_9FLAO|nr:glycerol-3-phosphate dehydrogenase/oxidase [Flavobacterium glycines]OCB69173.1 FAD-dependent oxidoreductase [Flavobacterium glycines]GEL11893.1 glycerol-3-phosphate dehydrogenase [Flavobacterium glycines]SDJ57797.1 glycerol-3-phosphate dehydrogenase [Flavobacterium glycines]
MNREEKLNQLRENPEFDIVIIGGGATGLGCAVDAASRGYKTLLLEKYDFAKGTSSRSTKLVHGGVRYLAQGNIHLVREALLERGRMLRNAPHVCHKLSFVVPVYKWWDKWYYGFGLWVYEFLSAKFSLGKTKILSKAATLKHLPDLDSTNLKGGILYYDGQFDDSRLAINLAQTATEHGALVLNYCGVTDFIKKDNKIIGLKAKDELSNQEYVIQSKVVVNATGVFADALLQKAEGHNLETIVPSQGIHLVLNKSYFEGLSAMLIPKTSDGRVLFVIPWHDKVLLGTTDTPVNKVMLEPKPLEEEIRFIINHFNKYSKHQIDYADVNSVFTGLRPLVKAGSEKKTALLSREHSIKVLPSGLVDVTGGKWTTYRKMAQQTINKVIQVSDLKFVRCKTRHLKVHGYSKQKINSHLAVYGCDAYLIQQMIADDDSLSEKIHPLYSYTKAEVVWAVKYEMALTVEDVLARRIRLLFLDARSAMEAVPIVAGIIASLLGKNPDWEREQILFFEKLAQGYLVV